MDTPIDVDIDSADPKLVEKFLKEKLKKYIPGLKWRSAAVDRFLFYGYKGLIPSLGTKISLVYDREENKSLISVLDPNYSGITLKLISIIRDGKLGRLPNLEIERCYA